MSRYIDADALITQDWYVQYIGNLEEDQVKDIIQQCKWYVMNAPTIDADRPKGEWIEGKYDLMCSNCENTQEYAKFPYCPYCGADMRGENDE